MSDVPSDTKSSIDYNDNLQTPANTTLITTTLTAYDFSDNPCRFFIAVTSANLTFVDRAGNTVTIPVIAGTQYWVRIKNVDVTAVAAILCCW